MMNHRIISFNIPRLTALHDRNEPFVFIKPHAVNSTVRRFLSNYFQDHGIHIMDQGYISGVDIKQQGWVDRHYLSISSAALKLMPNSLDESIQQQFQQYFGERWNEHPIYNALEALRALDCTPLDLAQYWLDSPVNKLAPGVYCGQIETFSNHRAYVINGFYPHLRSRFIHPENGIYWYQVSFPTQHLSWYEFRNHIIGATNPVKAVPESIRGWGYRHFNKLRLNQRPDNQDNIVHASASPLEALREKRIWIQLPFIRDVLGRQLLNLGYTPYQIDDLCDCLTFNVGVVSVDIGDLFDQRDTLNCMNILQEVYPVKPPA